MERDTLRNRSLDVVLLGVYKFVCFSTVNGAGQLRLHNAVRSEGEAARALERSRRLLATTDDTAHATVKRPQSAPAGIIDRVPPAAYPREAVVSGFKPAPGRQVDPEASWGGEAGSDECAPRLVSSQGGSQEGLAAASGGCLSRLSFLSAGGKIGMVGSAMSLLAGGPVEARQAWSNDEFGEMGTTKEEVDEHWGGPLPSPFQRPVYQLVFTVLPRWALRKVTPGSESLRWLVVPSPKDGAHWVCAESVLDKKKRVARANADSQVTLPGPRGKKVDRAVSTAAEYISCLLDPSSPDLAKAVAHVKAKSAPIVKLMHLSAGEAEKLLLDVVLTWLELNSRYSPSKGRHVPTAAQNVLC